MEGDLQGHGPEEKRAYGAMAVRAKDNQITVPLSCFFDDFFFGRAFEDLC
jgi:hypothetical protein